MELAKNLLRAPGKPILIAVVVLVFLMIVGRYGVMVAYGDKIHIEFGPR
jgi:hypothetical protein